MKEVIILILVLYSYALCGQVNIEIQDYLHASQKVLVDKERNSQIQSFWVTPQLWRILVGENEKVVEYNLLRMESELSNYLICGLSKINRKDNQELEFDTNLSPILINSENRQINYLNDDEIDKNIQELLIRFEALFGDNLGMFGTNFKLYIFDISNSKNLFDVYSSGSFKIQVDGSMIEYSLPLTCYKKKAVSTSIDLYEKSIKEFDKGNIIKSLDLAEKGINESEGIVQARLNLHLGILKLIQNQNEAAYKNLEKARKMEISNDKEFSIKLFWALGDYHIKYSNYGEANKQYEKILEIDPLYDAALINLGIYSINDLKLEKGIEYLTKAIANSTPHEGLARLNRGVAYLQTFELDSAKNDFEKCIIIDPLNPFPYHKLSLYYETIGDKTKTCEYLRKACELDFKNYGSDLDKNWYKVELESKCK